MSDDPKKPKIIVDDDWKERVQAEKAALDEQAPQTPAGDESTPEKLPPASFAMLVTSLATQALVALGQIPDASGKVVVQPEYAKHIIDTLAMLEEKTKGNLTSEESLMLTNVLHELRMAFVSAGTVKPPPDIQKPPGS